MKTQVRTTSHNDALGVVDRFIISSVTDRSIFSTDKKEMKFTAAGLKHLKADAGDIFYLFQGGLVGIAKSTLFTANPLANENARFINGFIDARRRSIRSKYYVRAIYEEGQHYWIAAFPYATLTAM